MCTGVCAHMDVSVWALEASALSSGLLVGDKRWFSVEKLTNTQCTHFLDLILRTDRWHSGGTN